MEKNIFVNQHSDDGEMRINIKGIQAVDVSEDEFNAKVLLVDGTWIRTDVLYDNLMKLIKEHLTI